MLRGTLQAAILHLAVLALALSGGCWQQPSSASPANPDADLARLFQQFGLVDGSRPQVLEAELNDRFASATPVALADGQAAIAGQISDGDDVDVYTLGPLRRGDRLVVTSMIDGPLDATAAVFDDQQCLIFANDDRIWRVDPRPYINVIIRHDSDPAYLAIASSTGSGHGQYGLLVQIYPGNDVPAPQPQIVLLDFDGADQVSIGGTGPLDLPAFDAGLISYELAGQTSQIVDGIEDVLRQDYADYDVQFYSTADGDLPDGQYTTLYFGGYNSALLGLADNVDYYNADPTQQAIVFIETFALFMPYRPTTTEIAQVIGNVASHELGHLLGLNHVADPTELMDSTATATQMLQDQDFHRAELKDEVFPIGYQDSARLLAESVGLR